MEWKDDSTAQISWAPAPNGAASRSPSHKVKFRRGDEGVYNALTVGGEGAATLRSLEPGSKYHVQVFRLGEGVDTSVTLVAESSLETRKVKGGGPIGGGRALRCNIYMRIYSIY